MLLFSATAFGQTASNLPEERITGQISHKVLFPGEILWFSLFSSNSLAEERDLSTISFVELLNKQNTSVLRKKVSLKQKNGHSYLELPDTLSTGIYTVVAYTNWMKNFGEEVFWKERIAVVNPKKSFNIPEKNLENKYPDNKQRNNSLNKGNIVFGKRQGVKINSLISTPLQDGVYSVTVRRKEPTLFKSVRQPNNENLEEGGSRYLPDYGGTLISGSLLDGKNKPVKGESVLLSLPGKSTDLLQSTTDIEGRFRFLLTTNDGNSDLVFILPDNESKIKLDDRYYNKFMKNGNSEIEVDSGAINFLENKYFYTQLAARFMQNNTIPVKRDSEDNTLFTFYGTPNRTFKMDNYVRLDSLAEYFHELVPSVKFQRVRNNYELGIINQKTKLELGPNPGLFVDGVLYSDYNSLARISSEDINQVDVIWEKYHYKDFTFDGIVSLQTKKADFYAVDLTDNMTRIIYPVVHENRFGFKVVKYNNKDNSGKQPDLRYLLHWNPVISPDKLAEEEFYTSDIDGYFEVSVIGYTKNGKRIRYTNEFLVK